MNLVRDRLAGDQRGDDGDDLPGRSSGAPSPGGSIGVECLHFSRDTRSGAQRAGSGCGAEPDFVGNGRVPRKGGAMNGVDSDEIDAQCRNVSAAESHGQDFVGKLSAAHCIRTSIGDLSFPDVSVVISNGDLQGGGPGTSLAAENADTVAAYLFNRHVRKVGNHIWSEVGGRILDLIEQLFCAGRPIEEAAGTLHLRKDGRAVALNLCNGKPQCRKSWNVFVPGIREVSARELTCAFQQVPDDRSLSKGVPVVKRPCELVD